MYIYIYILTLQIKDLEDPRKDFNQKNRSYNNIIFFLMNLFRNKSNFLNVSIIKYILTRVFFTIIVFQQLTYLFFLCYSTNPVHPFRRLQLKANESRSTISLPVILK